MVISTALYDNFAPSQTRCSETGQLGNVDLATVTFVEALLARGGDDDLGEAEAAIDRFEYLAVEFPWAAREVAVLRLRACCRRFW